MRGIRLGAIVLLVLGTCVAAPAQTAYPTKPIRIMVPYAAGGSIDPMARLVGDRLSKTVGQNVVIENRPGAGGNIGIEAVVRGAHDGYTLLAAPSGITINPSMFAKVPYDLEKDLTPVALVNRNAMFVMVNPASGMKTLADLAARAKAGGGGNLNYGIAGNGTLDHLVMEHLRASAKLDMVKITYQGVPKAITALLSGDVHVMVASATAAMPYLKSGQVRALAMTAAQRSPHVPDIPTMTELGYQDFVMYGWSMLFVPSGTPADIAVKLHADIAKVMAQPDVNKVIVDMGSEPQALSLAELKSYVRAEAARFAAIVKSSGAKAQ